MNKPETTRLARSPRSPGSPRSPSPPEDDRSIAPETRAALKLWVVLARAYASVAAHAVNHATGNGLSITEFAILEAAYHKGRMLLGDIQRRILVSSGGITFLVDRLAEKGLVAREDCPDDRRAKYVALTPAGSALIRDIFPSHALAIAHAVRGLSAEEQEEAIRLLRTLGLTAAGGELPPSPAKLRRHKESRASSRESRVASRERGPSET